MAYQRTHQSSFWNPPTQAKVSQFAPRPFAAQEDSHDSQEEIENEAFEQNKFDAFKLQLKEKYGTITPAEQERLGVLQAKMKDFWAPILDRVLPLSPNLANIDLHAPDQQVSTPDGADAQKQTQQPIGVSDRNGGMRLVPGAFQSRIRQNLPASPIQAKLTIGPPNDKYEQEADRVASQVVQQINAPTSAQSTLQLALSAARGQSVERMVEQEGELQAKPSISALQRRRSVPRQARQPLVEGSRSH